MTHCAEKVVQFGVGRRQVGVVTPGQDPRDNPGVLLFNSGLIHRVGPNRLYVRLARQLARQGFSTLRMDFSGIGDSLHRADDLRFDQGMLAEAREGFEVLQGETGCTRFVLAGICSGAEASVSIALADERVAAIAPIEFYGYESLGYQLWLYRSRLWSPTNWRRVLTGRSEAAAKLLGLVNEALGLGPSAETALAESERQLPARQRAQTVLASLRTILERGLPVSLLTSAGGPACYNFKRSFERPLQRFRDAGLLDVHALEGSDHTFTLRETQDEIVALLSAWLARSFASPRPSLEREALASVTSAASASVRAAANRASAGRAADAGEPAVIR